PSQDRNPSVLSAAAAQSALHSPVRAIMPQELTEAPFTWPAAQSRIFERECQTFAPTEHALIQGLASKKLPQKAPSASGNAPFSVVSAIRRALGPRSETTTVTP